MLMGLPCFCTIKFGGYWRQHPSTGSTLNFDRIYLGSENELFGPKLNRYKRNKTVSQLEVWGLQQEVRWILNESLFEILRLRERTFWTSGGVNGTR